MPPASLAATFDLRITSSRVVLPWSTWPMMVTTGARNLNSSGLSSTSFSTGLGGACTMPAPRSRFSASNRKPYLPHSFCAVISSMDWLTLAKTPNSIKSAINWNGLRFNCSARSRTTTGGLRVMSSPVAGGTNLGTGGAAGCAGALAAAFCGVEATTGLSAGRAGLLITAGLGGSFAGPTFAAVFGADFCGR